MSKKSNQMKQDVVAAMRQAGIRPEIIYAYEMTGFLVNEDSYKKLSASEKREYDNAFDEYVAKHGEG